MRTNGTHIIIDGKALRGGTERIKDGKTPYILNVIEATTNLVVAQLAMDTKENEQAAIPRLLGLLSLKDSLITIDAAGTTTDILQRIIDKGAHYLFTIKKNQPITYDEINDITPDKETYLKKGTVRKPKITTGDEAGDDRYRIGLVTDMGLTPQEMLDAKRRHWKIENGLHHVLDDTLREDRSPARKSKNNLAMLRKFVFNILQIARIREHASDGFPEMIDLFADDSNKIRFYVLHGIESFY